MPLLTERVCKLQGFAKECYEKKDESTLYRYFLSNDTDTTAAKNYFSRSEIYQT